MEQKKSNLFTLLIRTLSYVMKITPKEAILQIICSLVSSVTAGISTLLLSRLINILPLYIDGKSSLNRIIYLISVLIILFVIDKYTGSVFTNCRVRIETTTLYKMNIKLSEKCYKVPLIRYENAEFKNNLERARDCLYNTRLTDISLSFLNIVSGLLHVISISVVLASFNILLVPVSVISILPFLIMRIIRGNKFYEMRWFQAKKERKKNYLYGLFNNKDSMKEIRMFKTGDYIQGQWNDTKNEINQEVWDFRKKDTISFMVCDLIRITGYIMSIALVLYMTQKGILDIGMMSAAIMSFLVFQTEAGYFFINVGRIPECAAFTNDFYSFLDQEEEIAGNKIFNKDYEKIKVSNVSFTYPNTNKCAVNNLSIEIKKGETVVILGENGSGKTTLVMLLLGLFKCGSGMITYGDQEINSLDLNVFYDNVSVVSQNFNKYNLTLRENIAMGNITDINNNEKIIRILEKLKLGDLLAGDNPDVLLGAEFGGKELSIGQWQKIAIARSLFKDCEITILDEPTAALDPIIESEILKEFISLAKEKTAIIISHRVGLCKNADKIIVMKDGRSVECGTHQELIKNNGEYHRLYNSQSSWYS